jgi:putative tryptophan/tyrosine transport system substrate-binding protein
MMERRAFIARVVAGTLTAPRIARAQPARRIYRIGILSLGSASVGRSPSLKALLQGLSDLGYVDGRDFVIETRGAAGRPDRYPDLVAQLIALRLDVILAPGPVLPALKQATSTIPIIMTATLDPVRQGFVQSLARPGTNFTGFSLQSPDTTGKRLELLKELVPGPAPVAVLWDQPSIVEWQAAEAAARERGWKLLSLEIRSAAEIENVLREAVGARAGTLLVSAAGILFPNAQRFANLAAKSRLPVMYGLREYVEAGGLIAYGPDINDIWRRAAVFVDKIRKGARPGDLPVEQPTKFELVINLKSAKTLGLSVPQSLLARADEVIQ